MLAIDRLEVAPGTVLTLDRRAIGMKVEPAAGTTEPMALAVALTAYANASGGHDNITTALARVEGAATTEGETHG